MGSLSGIQMWETGDDMLVPILLMQRKEIILMQIGCLLTLRVYTRSSGSRCVGGWPRCRSLL